MESYFAVRYKPPGVNQLQEAGHVWSIWKIRPRCGNCCFIEHTEGQAHVLFLIARMERLVGKFSGHTKVPIHGRIYIMNLVQIAPADVTSFGSNVYIIELKIERGEHKLLPIDEIVPYIFNQMYWIEPNIRFEVSIRMSEVVARITIIFLKEF